MLDSIKRISGVAVVLVILGAVLYYYGKAVGKAEIKDQAYKDAIVSAQKDLTDLQARLKRQEDAANDAKEKLTIANADYQLSVAASVRLRNTIASLESRLKDSSSTGNCSSASKTGLLLSDVFGRCSERLIAMGHYADSARIAGEACEGQYDSLKSNP